MKKTKTLKIGTLLLALLFLVSGCGSTTTGNGAATTTGTGGSGTIKFTVVGPMTGDTASWGIETKNGAQIAVDEINAKGGINGKKLEMEVGDDQSNPNQASVLSERIIGNKDLLYVLGHVGSGCSLSALPTYEKVKMPVISPTNTSPTIVNEGYMNYFRVIASDNLIVEQQVMMAIKELGGQKPAIVWENTDYGKGSLDVALETLDKLGIKPVGNESFVAGVDRDFSGQVTKFKGAGADVVLIMGDYTAAALFAKQNSSLGLNAKLVGNSGTKSPKLMEIGGKDVNGFYAMTSFDSNDKRPEQATFVKNYEEKYKEQPGEFASHAYDIVYLVKKAYEAGGTTRETLIQKLHELKGFEGVTGPIEFDAKGDVPNKKVMVTIVKNNQFESYIPTKY